MNSGHLWGEHGSCKWVEVKGSIYFYSLKFGMFEYLKRNALRIGVPRVLTSCSSSALKKAPEGETLGCMHTRTLGKGWWAALSGQSDVCLEVGV